MKHLIGVDLGGTRLRAVRIDVKGHVFQHHSVATAASAGPDVVVDQIVALVDQVIGDFNRADIFGIGIGSPGPMDPFEGVVLNAPNLHGWLNVPLRAMLQQRTGLPVMVNNDGNVAALGEWYLGSGRGCQDFIYMAIGTGLGGGIIVNGQLLLGRKGMAAEIGHMTIQHDGPLCSCGQIGCWESFVCGPALARFAAEALQSGSPSRLQDVARQGPVTAPDIFWAAEQGDALALDLLRREGELLGVGIVNLLHLFSPERIAIGGGVAQGLVWLEPHIRQVIATRAFPPYRDVPVHYAQLGDQAGVIGAASLFFAAMNASTNQ